MSYISLKNKIALIRCRETIFIIARHFIMPIINSITTIDGIFWTDIWQSFSFHFLSRQNTMAKEIVVIIKRNHSKMFKLEWMCDVRIANPKVDKNIVIFELCIGYVNVCISCPGFSGISSHRPAHVTYPVQKMSE